MMPNSLKLGLLVYGYFPKKLFLDPLSQSFRIRTEGIFVNSVFWLCFKAWAWEISEKTGPVKSGEKPGCKIRKEGVGETPP